MGFATERLRSWDRLSAFQRHGWMYRGQRCARWPLQTALERCCDRRSVRWAARWAVEYRLSREFRRAYHEYGTHIPAKASTLEWLALMQHPLHCSPPRPSGAMPSVLVMIHEAGGWSIFVDDREELPNGQTVRWRHVCDVDTRDEGYAVLDMLRRRRTGGLNPTCP
jgi:hypothetical protein